MKNLIAAWKGVEEDISEHEFLEDKLCQIIQLMKEADGDKGVSKLTYEYKYKKLKITICYDKSNYFKSE